MYILYKYTHTHIYFNPFNCEIHRTVHKISMQLNELLQKNTTQLKKENIACILIFMKFIHVVIHSCSLFIFVTVWYSIIYIHPDLFILLLMTTGLFVVLSMNILVYVSWTCDYIDRSGIVGSQDRHMCLALVNTNYLPKQSYKLSFPPAALYKFQ